MPKPDAIVCKRCGKNTAVVERKIVAHGPGPDGQVFCPGSNYDFAAHEQKQKQKTKLGGSAKDQPNVNIRQAQ